MYLRHVRPGVDIARGMLEGWRVAGCSECGHAENTHAYRRDFLKGTVMSVRRDGSGWVGDWPAVRGGGGAVRIFFFFYLLNGSDG